MRIRRVFVALVVVALVPMTCAQLNSRRNNPNSDYNTDIARGLITGHAVVHKFGKAGDVDASDLADIWDGATDTIAGFTKTLLYTYSTAADIDTISSSSASDTEIIEVQGLDEDWALVVQDATLSGTAHITLATPLIRVFRMKNVGDTDLVGNVFCYVEGTTTTPGIPDTEADVRAIIQIGNNQTLMAQYTIPLGKSGYMKQLWASIAKAQTQISTIQMFHRANPTGVFQLKHNSALSNISPFALPFIIPLDGLPAMTDIRIQADSSAANGSISSGFEIELIDD